MEMEMKISRFPTTVFGNDSLARPLVGAREEWARPVDSKKSRHTVEAWRLSNGLVGRVVMTCDRKKFPLVENFLSPNFEIDGSWKSAGGWMGQCPRPIAKNEPENGDIMRRNISGFP